MTTTCTCSGRTLTSERDRASLFLWCWFHAASNVYSIQIVQGRLDGWARHLRLPPRLVNIAIVAVSRLPQNALATTLTKLLQVPSFVLVCVALPLLVAGYFMGRDVTLTFRSACALSAAPERSESSCWETADYIARDDPSRRVEALANASKTCLRSERMYKTIWSIWALCFLLTWVVRVLSYLNTTQAHAVVTAGLCLRRRVCEALAPAHPGHPPQPGQRERWRHSWR